MDSEDARQSRVARPSGREAGMVERTFPRFVVELPCLYSMNNGPDWNGTALNLSLGGCAIRGTTAVRKGDYLRVLIFPSTNQAPVEVGLAPVRWATNEQFGVEFITLLPHDAKRLQSYIALMESDSREVE